VNHFWAENNINIEYVFQKTRKFIYDEINPAGGHKNSLME